MVIFPTRHFLFKLITQRLFDTYTLLNRFSLELLIRNSRMFRKQVSCRTKNTRSNWLRVRLFLFRTFWEDTYATLVQLQCSTCCFTENSRPNFRTREKAVLACKLVCLFLSKIFSLIRLYERPVDGKDIKQFCGTSRKLFGVIYCFLWIALASYWYSKV